MQPLFRKIWVGFRRVRWAIALFCAVLAIGVSPAIAQASSDFPYEHHWFSVAQDSAQTPLEGLQLAWCKTAECQQPVLLAEYGQCDQAGCLSNAAITSDLSCLSKTISWTRDTCASGTFLFVRNTLTTPEAQPGDDTSSADKATALSSYGDQDWFQIIGQFSDRLRTSNAMQIKAASDRSGAVEGFWLVTVEASTLSLAPDRQPSAQLPCKTYDPILWLCPSFWLGLMLMLLTEGLVAFVYLWRSQIRRQIMYETLAAIGLANVLSAPFIWEWTLFSLQTTWNLALGLIYLGIAMIYPLMLSRQRSRPKRWRIMGSSLLLPGLYILGLCGWVAIVIFNYYHWVSSPRLIGLGVVLLYEAGVIVLLSRGTVSWRRASILSLLTNGASVGLAWWLLPLL